MNSKVGLSLNTTPNSRYRIAKRFENTHAILLKFII